MTRAGDLLDDLRTALRSLRKRPGFAAIVVVTLAVALGANTTVFSVLEQALLRPLPFPGAARLVYLFRENEQQGFRVTATLSAARSWADQARSFDALEYFESTRVTLLGHGEPRGLAAATVSPGLFRLLGVRPARGAGLAAAEDAAATPVVLSDRLWHELFAGSPSALGTSLDLDGHLYSVAGVMGPGLRSLPPVGEVDLWLPFDPGVPAGSTSVEILARLAPGVAPATAQEELLALDQHRADGGALGQWRPEVIAPAELFGQFLGRQLLVLQAAVGLLLLIGCANVGNLFLVRAAGRGEEMAVRAALGASRGRLAQTLLLESFLLAGAGAVLGLALARWGGRLLIRIHDWPLLDLQGVRADLGLYGFTAAVALLATVAFGLAPALAASRTDLGDAHRGGARSGGGTRAGGRARAGLVVVEIALSLILLVGAGLLTKSFLSLLATDPGFEASGLVALRLELPDSRYGSEESQAAFVRGLREGIAAAGLEATVTSAAPTQGGLAFGHLQAEGAAPPPADAPPDTVALVSVDAAYFQTLRLPVLEGRAFGERDLAAAADGSPEVPVLVGPEMAQHLWPGESAVGRRFRLGIDPDDAWFRVVGVADDAAQLGLRRSFKLQLYTPFTSGSRVTVIVRGGPEMGLAAAVDRVRGQVHALDPALPIRSVDPVDQLLRDDLAGPRFQATLMLGFAGVALALAGLGVYAVLAYAVRRRAFEMGVRAALGARPGQVLALVARHGGGLAVAGLTLGLVAALGLSRLLGHLIGRVSPHDPLVFTGAAAALLVVCALATLLPALRAARLDPARVLREE